MTDPHKARVQRQTLRQTLAAVAAVAAAFSMAVLFLLVANHLRLARAHPLDAPALERLAKQARENPKNADAVEVFRDMDDIARRAFFSAQSFNRTGAALLLVGVGVLLAALRARRALAPPPPDPMALPTPPDAGTLSHTRRTALAVAIIAIFAFAAVIALQTRGKHQTPAAPSGSPAPDAAAASPHAPAPAGDPAEEWPGFRGPNNLGVSAHANPPTDWDGPSGRNIAWKIEVPLPGFSSPAIWGDRIFLTGATADAREVFSFATADGKLLWSHKIQPMPGTPQKAPEVGEDTGYAASSPATDGVRVYAIFANGDLVCLDRDGHKAWGLNLGVPDNPYGHGSSLLVWRNLLIVQYDHAAEAFLSAFDTATGRVAWETKRKVDPSWATPVLADLPTGPALITIATPFVAAYDAATGRELWKREVLAGELASSPGYANGMAFANDDGGRLFAFNAATGEPAWEAEVDTPDVSTPLAIGPNIWIANSGASVICCDAATGKVVAQHEFDESYYASPVAAAGRVYVFDRKGSARIFDAAHPDKPSEPLAMGETVVATPALVGRRMYIRAEKHLFCIEAAK